MIKQWTLTFKVFLHKVSILSNLEILPFTLCQFTFNNNHSNGNLHVFVTRQLCGCFTAHVFLRQMCPRNLSTAFFVINWNKVLVQEKNHRYWLFSIWNSVCHHVECMKSDGCHYFLHDLFGTLMNKKSSF